MKLLKFYLLVVIISSQYILAQQQICGNITPENPVVPNQLYNSTLSWYIPVIFHVIKRSDGSGDVLDSQLIDQINALNTGFYESGGFTFYLAGIRRITNDYWQNLVAPDPNFPPSQQETDMKNSLSIDPDHALNVYITSTAGSTKGWATFPDYYYASQNHALHGVVMRANVLPSGNDPDNNMGVILVHEVGHYLGLFHTFNEFNKCQDADKVDDTPIHLQNLGCPPDTTDTCTGQPGFDPIHNYMNYTNDPCRTEFTVGQSLRMNQMVQYWKPYLGGSIINISNDITINSGNSLQLLGNITVNFASGNRIIVNGTFNSNSVTFTSNSNWGGIQFNSGSSGNLNGCTINNVQTYGGAAIVINGPSPTIQNCTIENNVGATSGIQILSNGQPYIYNNIIRNNPEHGIYISHSNPYIRYNMITGSTSASKASVYCYNFASPLFGGIGGGTSEGKNTLQSGYYGIAADYYSTPSAGGSDVAYNNRFINNSYANAYANYYSTIYARYDWWGSSTPDPNKIIAVIGSTIYWNPYLTSDPGPSRSMLGSPNSNDEALATDISFSINNSGSPNNNEIQQSVVLDDLLKARELRFTKNYQEAFNIYKSILASKGETSEAKIALVELGNTYAETKDVRILVFIKGFVQMKNDLYGLKPIAMQALSKIYTSEKSINEAIEINNQLINDYHGTIHERSGEMNLFFIYYNTGKYDFAKEMLSLVKVNFERNDEIAAAEWLMRSVGYMPIDLNKQIKKIDNELLITDFSIEQNYPNPFNPTTKISFSIPQKSQIKLKVFDVLGREIANLAEGVYEAGKYEVTFDASKLPSGVYFYNLTTGSNSISKKMLLVK